MKRILIVGMVLLCGAGMVLILSDKNKKAPTDKFAPSDWFFRQRAFPRGEIPTSDYYRAMKQVHELAATSLKTGQNTWELAGPVNIGGRIQDIEMPRKDKTIMYVGAASGGIFKSTDTGRSWTPIFDHALTQSIGDIDLFRGDEKIIWVGTGEPNAGGGSINYDGHGVYKSNDAGASFTPAGLENSGSIGRVQIHPTNPDIVFVAAMGHLFGENPERGIFRTKNGGTTWENVLYISDSTGGIDLCINPVNPSIIYAALWERNRRQDYRNYGGTTGGIFRSSDGGDTWTKLTNGLPGGELGRIGIDICDSNPQVLYAAISNSGGYLKGIYKTTDGGDHWSRTGAEIEPTNNSQWWYCIVNVDPSNPDIVFFSGLRVFKTTDGGAHWSGSFNNAHVDMHGVFIHPQESAFTILGGDGGIDMSSNGGSTYTHVLTLPITQFYTCEIDNLQPHRLYGGTQDNGTLRTQSGSPSGWSSIYGGDGFYVKIDPTDNKYVYAESQFGGFGRSINGGSSFTNGKSGIGSEITNWRTPFILDPKTPSILYLGTKKVYKSTNRAVSWTAISGDLTNGTGPDDRWGTIYALAASPVNSKIIYAGTDDGNVWNTLNGGTSWNRIDATLPERWVTSVTTDPFDEATAYVTFSGYRWDSYDSHVFRTVNNGLNWEDIGNGLPDMPANDFLVDPEIPGTYYLATDGGVFISRNAGLNWEIYGSGIPIVPVLDLAIHNSSRTLVAATFGRSMYTTSLVSGTGTGDLAVSKSEIKIYPNPVTDQATISFSLDQTDHARLVILDIRGTLVRDLTASLRQGENKIIWDGRTDAGSRIAGGTCFIRLISGGRSWSRQVQVVR